MKMMAKLLLVIVWFLSYIHAQEVALRSTHPDLGLNEKQVIAKYGYPLETHAIKTEDGYILKAFRISSGRNAPITQQKPVVLFMAGLICNSAAWVLAGPERSLGFILADQGYDVWLANYRGSTWGKKHETLSPSRNAKEFWNYSFQDIGYYDLPAHIDYILNLTKQEKLFYIGHSQGATSFMAMASTRPEYNKKIRLMCAFAPGIYMDNTISPIFSLIGRYASEAKSILENHRVYEIISHSPLIALLGQMCCNDDSPFQPICTSLMFFVFGVSQNYNQTIAPLMLNYFPSGMSAKQMLHYGQLTASKKFQQFDYGDAENMIKYNQTSPPEYDFSMITTPVAIYYGGNDIICSDVDVEYSAARLPNLVEMKLIKGFNHMDLLWADDVVSLLYNDVIKIMKQYQQR